MKPKRGFDKHHKQVCENCVYKYLGEDVEEQRVCSVCTSLFLPLFSPSDSKCKKCVESTKKIQEEKAQKTLQRERSVPTSEFTFITTKTSERERKRIELEEKKLDREKRRRDAEEAARPRKEKEKRQMEETVREARQRQMRKECDYKFGTGKNNTRGRKNSKRLWWKFYGEAKSAMCPVCNNCKMTPRVNEDASKGVSGERFQVGHNIPIAKGGDNSWRNVRPICAYCNGDQGTKTFREYAARELPPPVKRDFKGYRITEVISQKEKGLYEVARSGLEGTDYVPLEILLGCEVLTKFMRKYNLEEEDL